MLWPNLVLLLVAFVYIRATSERGISKHSNIELGRNAYFRGIYKCAFMFYLKIIFGTISLSAESSYERCECPEILGPFLHMH